MIESNMRKWLLSLLMLAAVLPAAGQFRTGSVLDDLDDGETVSSLKEHVRTLSAASMEGRKAGSEGEKAAAVYLTEALKAYGIDILSAPEGDSET